MPERVDVISSSSERVSPEHVTISTAAVDDSVSSVPSASVPEVHKVCESGSDSSVSSSSCVELCDSSISPEPSVSKAADENYSVEKVEMKDASALVTVSEVRTRNQQVLEGIALLVLRYQMRNGMVTWELQLW